MSDFMRIRSHTAGARSGGDVLQPIYHQPTTTTTTTTTNNNTNNNPVFSPCWQSANVPFNLFIADCGARVFVWPQVRPLTHT